MKKYNHPADDFFREMLKDHRLTPSDEARKAFLKDAMELPPVKRNGRTGLILLSVFLVLAGLGFILWLTADKGTSGATPVKTEAPKTGATRNISQSQSNQPVTVVNPHLVQINKPAASKNTLPQQQFTAQEETQTTLQQPLKTNAVAENPQHLESGSPAALADVLSTPPANPETLKPSNPSARSDLTSQPSVRPDSSFNRPGSKTKAASPSGNHSRFNPAIGVYYSPEWLFNTLEGTKFINNFGVEGTFRFGRFSIRTGAGVSIHKGTNELSVAYNDFIGSYSKLDSIEFKWSTANQKYVPTMFISQKNVWDSLMKLEYLHVVKRYTYLQIPMIMGYDFRQSDAVSIGVRVGPVMSVMLQSKQLSAAYDPGTKRIISINDIAPEQVSLNWQAMAGIDISIKLTRDLQLEIEPSVRYYFNSVYEKPVPLWKPWSAGIRAAILVKL